jgi:hypothetical protein
MNEITLLEIIMTGVILINFALWFIAGMMTAKAKVKTALLDESKRGYKPPTRRPTIINEGKRTMFNPWNPISKQQIPLKIKVDLQTEKEGEIEYIDKAMLLRRNPIEFKPEFIKYKKIIAWRYSE